MLAEVRGQFTSPMLVGGRLAFLSDHEGTGNLYSCALDGTGLRRHSDHDGAYARNASTDGQRVIYSCDGRIWLLDSLDADGPRPLEIALGSVPPGRTPRLISAEDHVGALSCDATGQASVVEVRGTVHWLSHRDGPAVALSVTPGGRARLPGVLGKDGAAVWVTDADGADALEIGTARPAGLPAEPRRIAGGQIGRVCELAAAPDGSKVAVAALDGGLRVVDVATGAVTDLADLRQRRGQRPGLVTGLGLAGLVPRRRVPAAVPAADGPGGRRDDDRRDRRPVHRHRAGLHHRRQVRGLPVQAQLRPDLRRALVRPRRSRSARGPTWCRWPPRRCPRSARSRAGGR